MATPNSNSPATAANPILIDLDRPASWPAEVLAFLNDHQELFCQWERDASKVGAKAYDRAIGELQHVLQPFALRGWHCTRLTNEEMEQVRLHGLVLPNRQMLERRIDSLVAQSVLDADTAHLLKTRNQAGDSNRAGMVWFCFFPPAVAGETGIGRFFRHWGGEALYNSHEDDPVTSPVLRRIGTPCLIEADVPIASLAVHGDPVFKIVREFVRATCDPGAETFDYEGRIVMPLPGALVRRLIIFPEPEFMQLTGCAQWCAPPTA